MFRLMVTRRICSHIDDDIHVFGPKAVTLQIPQQVHGMIDGVDVGKFAVEVLPDARFDHHVLPTGLHQDTVETQLDPVAAVRRNFLFPQDLRDHAEHLSAIEGEAAVAQCVNFKVAKLHTVVGCRFLVFGSSLLSFLFDFGFSRFEFAGLGLFHQLN